MHPSIKKAYDEGNHPLARHPIHRIYGRDLVNQSYEYLANRSNYPLDAQAIMMDIMQTLERIISIEASHKEQLEALAIQIVKEVWNITDEVEFNPNLAAQPEFSLDNYSPELDPNEVVGSGDDLTPDDQREINKRITLNTMTHGAALHHMLSSHHLVKKALDDIDPNLLKLYDNIAHKSQMSHWVLDLQMVLNTIGQQGGEVSVEWPEEESELGAITVNATAVIFPLLVHELSKGVMEILTAHGLPQDQQTLQKVYKHADKPEHEILHYYVGPALWRKFLKVVEPSKLSAVISILARLDPNQMHKIIGYVVDNPDRATEMINKLLQDEEPETENLEELEPESENPEDINWDEMTESKIKIIADYITECPDVFNETLSPVAPTRPKPIAPSKPARPTPRPDPFRPPKPAVNPVPKAKKGKRKEIFDVPLDDISAIADSMEDL